MPKFDEAFFEAERKKLLAADAAKKDEGRDISEMDVVTYLKDVAERLRQVPVMHGVDDGDISRLYSLANELERVNRQFDAMNAAPDGYTTHAWQQIAKRFRKATESTW